MKTGLKRMHNLLSRLKEFIKFGMVGVLNTAFSLIIYTGFLWLGVNYMIATSIGYISGIFLAYMLNTKYVFNKGISFKNMIKFFSVYWLSFLGNLIYMYTLVEIIGVNKIIAQFVAISINMVFNFIMSKIWVFKS